jgi:hypothetical protein
LDLAEVVAQAEVTVGIGTGNEATVGGGLFAVDVEELRGGLKVRAGETGVGMWTILLGWSTAVPVGKGVTDP